MVNISKRQMEALRQAIRAEFIRRTLAGIREAVPNFLAGPDDATALRWVEDSVTKAESYGLSTEREIRDFIVIQIVTMEKFDTDPRFAPAREALTDVTLSPGDRLARARQRVAEVMTRKDRG
jgi:hypothetical protein